jgi:haloacetate dehalogenase
MLERRLAADVDEQRVERVFLGVSERRLRVHRGRLATNDAIVPVMLDGFSAERIAANDTELFVRIGGAGPPLVCLHGYPQSHLTWRHVAPALAERYTVVLPDLRGYGASASPDSDDAHLNYSKRTMARDIVALMAKLGHDRFLLAGHDRGARVAYRLTLDAPQCVTAVAVLDIIPTIENWEAMDYRRAYGAYHWPFLAQPAPLPERLIGSDPQWYCRQQIGAWMETPGASDEAALDAYCEAFARPGAVHAACEDYRAGYTCDLEHDRADRDAGKRIGAPLLALWGGGLDGKRSAHFPAVWQRWATNLSTAHLPCGHFLMEELPRETASTLRAFFDAHVEGAGA